MAVVMAKKVYLTRKSVHAVIEAHAAQNEGDGMKRALGWASLMSLGIGGIIGAGIFVLTGTAAANYAGPGVMISFVLSGARLRLCGAVLRGARLAHSRRGQHLHLHLRYAWRDFRVDHRLEPDARICRRRGDRRGRLGRLFQPRDAGFWHSHSVPIHPRLFLRRRGMCMGCSMFLRRRSSCF